MGVDFLTKGELVPTIRDLRDRANVEGPQPTSILDAQRAVESYVNIRGRRPLRYAPKSSVADVRTAVRAGRFVQCAIDYGKWNALLARTGDPDYGDGHSIGVLGFRMEEQPQWLTWDPLCDGRRDGIPRGPVWVFAWKVIDALEAFTPGAGIQAGVFYGGQLRERR